MGRRLTLISTAVGLIVTVGAAAFGIMSFIGWPPYAAQASVDELAEQVQANSVTSLYIQLENAIKSGDRQRVLRLCWAIQNATGQKPAGCP